MLALNKLIESLNKNKIEKMNYAIPDLWFLEDYKIDYRKIPNNEILVNPYDFYKAVITDYIFKVKKENINYDLSLSRALNIKPTGGNWVKKSVLYSMMIRTSSSYDNDRSYSLDLSNFDGLNETGSFIKTLALLPLLKRLGVNVLYLLPISKYSLVNKKGELGSPYSVESFLKLDPLLKDSLTKDDLTIEEEFKCLVEACHILNIRLTIDIIPRTNSICSELIVSHPEWFYWINKKDKNKFHSPHIDGIYPNTYPAPKLMKEVFKNKNTIDFIKIFKENPKSLDIDKFNTIKENNPEKFIKEIENKFNLTVAPAFSDNINDPQPAWTDITFFRMYLDDPVYTRKYINFKHNPYILFDTIKSDLYPGLIPNIELWNMLSDVIPYYINNFGIDGARIDMGHALPYDLLKLIMDKAKSIDSDFLFIAEELNMSKDKISKKIGYNAMIGNSFWALPRTDEGEFKYFIDHAITKKIPVFFASETHDTKRSAMRYGGMKFTRFMTILSYFIPNVIPFINSGQEFYEVEPMNLGLDASNDDLLSLDVNDPYYKKLALFDKYELHYRNDNRFEIINHLVDPLKIRNRWINKMINKNNYIKLDIENDNKYLVSIAYIDKRNNKSLIILGNSNMNEGFGITVILDKLKEKISLDNRLPKLMYATYEMPRVFDNLDINKNINTYLGSGEIKIIEY